MPSSVSYTVDLTEGESTLDLLELPESIRGTLPPPDLSVRNLLNYPINRKGLRQVAYASRLKFSPKKSDLTEEKLMELLNTFRFPDAARIEDYASSIAKAGSSAKLFKSFQLPFDPRTRLEPAIIEPGALLPLWMVKYWLMRQEAATEKRRWAPAGRALAAHTAETQDILQRIPWNIYFKSTPVDHSRDLVEFCSVKDWMSDKNVDIMVQVLNDKLEHVDPGVKILPTSYQQGMVRAFKTGKWPDHLKLAAMDTKYQRYGVVFCIDCENSTIPSLHSDRPRPNHWVSTIVDLKEGVIYYADPMGGRRSTDVDNVLKSWLRERFKGKFRTELLNCCKQNDTFSCAILSINSMAHSLDPAQFPLMDGLSDIAERRLWYLKQFLDGNAFQVAEPPLNPTKYQATSVLIREEAEDGACRNHGNGFPDLAKSRIPSMEFINELNQDKIEDKECSNNGVDSPIIPSALPQNEPIKCHLQALFTHLGASASQHGWLDQALHLQKRFHDQLMSIIGSSQVHRVFMDDSKRQLWNVLWNEWTSFAHAQEVARKSSTVLLPLLNGIRDLGLSLVLEGFDGIVEMENMLKTLPSHIRYSTTVLASEKLLVSIHQENGRPVPWTIEHFRLMVNQQEGKSATWAGSKGPWIPKTGLELAVQGLKSSGEDITKIFQFIRQECGLESICAAWPNSELNCHHFVLCNGEDVEKVLFREVPETNAYITLTYSMACWFPGLPFLKLPLHGCERVYFLDDSGVHHFESDLALLLQINGRTIEGYGSISHDGRGDCINDTLDIRNSKPLSILRKAVLARDRLLFDYGARTLSAMLKSDIKASILWKMPGLLADHIYSEIRRALRPESSYPQIHYIFTTLELACLRHMSTPHQTIGLYHPQCQQPSFFLPILQIISASEAKFVLFDDGSGPAQEFYTAYISACHAWGLTSQVMVLNAYNDARTSIDADILLALTNNATQVDRVLHQVRFGGTIFTPAILKDNVAMRWVYAGGVGENVVYKYSKTV